MLTAGQHLPPSWRTRVPSVPSWSVQNRLRHEGPIATDQIRSFRRFAQECRLAGAHVLEIGGVMPSDVVSAEGVSKWTSIDPLANSAWTTNKHQMIPEDITHTSLEDSCADLVFSCNALQHISPLSSTMVAIRRLLAPNGIAWLHFGPIWSGPDGHHLDITYNGRHLTFFEHSLLPHWSQLLLSSEELRTMLGSCLEADLASVIVDYVFNHPSLNRCFFEDYLDAANASGLSLMHLETSQELDYAYSLPDYVGLNDFQASTMRRFRELYGCHNPFVREVLMVLIRLE